MQNLYEQQENGVEIEIRNTDGPNISKDHKLEVYDEM
jgi:hypothetical protein